MSFITACIGGWVPDRHYLLDSPLPFPSFESERVALPVAQSEGQLFLNCMRDRVAEGLDYTVNDLHLVLAYYTIRDLKTSSINEKNLSEVAECIEALLSANI